MVDSSVKLFESQEIRSAWNEDEEEWYFSIVDVVGALTESQDGRKYWNKLKQRLKDEGNETVTNCHQLKLKAADGKMRLTDVATTEQILRIVQSIPSKKAEPFKLWLAQVGSERIDEIIDPELTLDRALETYLKKGVRPQLGQPAPANHPGAQGAHRRVGEARRREGQGVRYPHRRDNARLVGDDHSPVQGSQRPQEGEPAR